MTHVVSEIFKDGPVDRFGLRGDPVFLELFRKAFSKGSYAIFRKKIRRGYKNDLSRLNWKRI